MIQPLNLIYLCEQISTTKKYVGYTTLGLAERIQLHIKDVQKIIRGQTIEHELSLHTAIHQFGESDFRWSILETFLDDVHIDVLKSAEIQAIREQNSYAFGPGRGFNLTLGGDGTSGHKWSDEQRQKLALINKEIANRPDVKLAKSLATKGRVKPAGWGAHLHEPWTDIRKHNHSMAMSTPERKKRRSELSLKMWANRSEEERINQAKRGVTSFQKRMQTDQEFSQKINDMRRVNALQRMKPVQQLDMNGNVVCEYASVTEAHQKTGIWNINAACLGRRQNAGGFVWKFKQ